MKKNKQRMTHKKIETTLVDIIFPVHGRFDIFKPCLDALDAAADGISYHVYAVDNNSPDTNEARAFYNSLSDNSKITVVRNRENLGFPKACNVGFRKGGSPLVFFLNTDVIMRPGSLFRLVSNMDDPKVGVAGMKLVFPADYSNSGLRSDNIVRPVNKVQHVGLSTNIQGMFIHHLIGWSEDHPKVNAIRDVYAVTGAALMTRRKLYRDAGGFFEGYGLGTWEDVDFCLTVRDMGYNVIVDVKSVGVHYTGATAEKYQIQYPMDFNRLVFLQRWATKLNYTEHTVW